MFALAAWWILVALLFGFLDCSLSDHVEEHEQEEEHKQVVEDSVQKKVGDVFLLPEYMLGNFKKESTLKPSLDAALNELLKTLFPVHTNKQNKVTGEISIDIDTFVFPKSYSKFFLNVPWKENYFGHFLTTVSKLDGNKLIKDQVRVEGGQKSREVREFYDLDRDGVYETMYLSTLNDGHTTVDIYKREGILHEENAEEAVENASRRRESNAAVSGFL